jgi:hypothetical protein
MYIFCILGVAAVSLPLLQLECAKMTWRPNHVGNRHRFRASGLRHACANHTPQKRVHALRRSNSGIRSTSKKTCRSGAFNSKARDSQGRRHLRAGFPRVRRASTGPPRAPDRLLAAFRSPFRGPGRLESRPRRRPKGVAHSRHLSMRLPRRPEGSHRPGPRPAPRGLAAAVPGPRREPNPARLEPGPLGTPDRLLAALRSPFRGPEEARIVTLTPPQRCRTLAPPSGRPPTPPQRLASSRRPASSPPPPPHDRLLAAPRSPFRGPEMPKSRPRRRPEGVAHWRHLSARLPRHLEGSHRPSSSPRPAPRGPAVAVSAPRREPNRDPNAAPQVSHTGDAFWDDSPPRPEGRRRLASGPRPPPRGPPVVVSGPRTARNLDPNDAPMVSHLGDAFRATFPAFGKLPPVHLEPPTGSSRPCGRHLGAPKGPNRDPNAAPKVSHVGDTFRCDFLGIWKAPTGPAPDRLLTASRSPFQGPEESRIATLTPPQRCRTSATPLG